MKRSIGCCAADGAKRLVVGFYGTIGIVFALVAIGYGLSAARWVKRETGDGLSDFVIVVAIPVLLFRTLATADFGGADPVPLWIAYFTGVAVTWVLATVTLRRGFGRDARGGVVAGLSAAFANLVLLGIPMILALFGQEGFAILSLLLAVHLPIMMATSVILYEIAQRRDGVQTGAVSAGAVVGRFLRGMASNPIVIGILLGVAWRFTGWTLPIFAADLVDRLAGVAGTVALIALGMSLDKFGIARNVGQGAATAAIKLFVMPSVVTLVALLIDLEPAMAHVAIVGAAMPTGVNPYLIAARLGTGEALASNTMVVATAIAPLSLLGWLWVAQALF